MTSDQEAGAVVILLGIVGVLFYLLPTVIAVSRSKPNTGAIFAVNLFLGWSLIGWVIALAWSLMADASKS